MKWDNNPRLFQCIPNRTMHSPSTSDLQHRLSPQPNYDLSSHRNLISDLHNELSNLKSQFTKLIYKSNDENQHSTDQYASQKVTPQLDESNGFIQTQNTHNRHQDQKPRIQLNKLNRESSFRRNVPEEGRKTISKIGTQSKNELAMTTIPVYSKVRTESKEIGIQSTLPSVQLSELNKFKQLNQELESKIKELQQFIRNLQHQLWAQSEQFRQERESNHQLTARLSSELEEQKNRKLRALTDKQQLSKIIIKLKKDIEIGQREKLAHQSASQQQIKRVDHEYHVKMVEQAQKWDSQRLSLINNFNGQIANKDQYIANLIKQIQVHSQQTNSTVLQMQSTLKKKCQEETLIIGELECMKSQNKNLQQKLSIESEKVNELMKQKDSWENRVQRVEVEVDYDMIIKGKDQTIQNLMNDLGCLEKQANQCKNVCNQISSILGEVNESIITDKISLMNMKYKLTHI